MKIRFKSFIICIIALSAPLPLDAQRPDGRYRNLDELIESLAETLEEGEEFTSWLDELQEMFENPMNVNTASKDDLLKIPFLNDITASQIIEYRNKFGPFLSVFEVASVPGIGSDLAEKISFFIVSGEEDRSTVKS
jgi:competence ComEA-like helix-hairpin-helix protein